MKVSIFKCKDENKEAVERSLKKYPVVGIIGSLEDLSSKRGFVVYSGDESYPLRDGVYTMPSRMFHLS